jgi:hypothetical protein
LSGDRDINYSSVRLAANKKKINNLVAREKDGGVGVAVVVIWFEGDVYAESN